MILKAAVPCVSRTAALLILYVFALSAVLAVTKMTNEILAKFGKTVFPSAAMRQFL